MCTMDVLRRVRLLFTKKNKKRSRVSRSKKDFDHPKNFERRWCNRHQVIFPSSEMVKLVSPRSLTERGLSSAFVELLLYGRAQNFCGCYSDDELPYNLHLYNEDSFTIVVNLSKRWQPGTHFIVIAKTSKAVIYLDSFGRKPPPQCDGIRAFLRASPLPLHYNDQQLQAFDSVYCGFFAILFCLLHSRNEEWTLRNSELPVFDGENLKKNDLIVLEHIRKFVRNEIVSG